MPANRSTTVTESIFRRKSKFFMKHIQFGRKDVIFITFKKHHYVKLLSYNKIKREFFEQILISDQPNKNRNFNLSS